MDQDKKPNLFEHVFYYEGRRHSLQAANMFEALPMAIAFFNPPKGMEYLVTPETLAQKFPEREKFLQGMEKRRDWLQRLKAGDDVGYRTHPNVDVRKVLRVTPKQVFVAVNDSWRSVAAFWKKNGREVGGPPVLAPYLEMPKA